MIEMPLYEPPVVQNVQYSNDSDRDTTKCLYDLTEKPRRDHGFEASLVLVEQPVEICHVILNLEIISRPLRIKTLGCHFVVMFPYVSSFIP